MDMFAAGRQYIEQLTTRKPGMKAVLMDRYTAPQISMLYSPGEMLQNEIYMFQRIEDVKPGPAPARLDGITALVLIRPCHASIRALMTELRNPRFSRYDLCFTNILDPEDLERLAAADILGRVDEVSEYYLDYTVIDRHLFSVGITGCVGRRMTTWAPGMLEYTAKSVYSVMRALDRFPVVRYQGSSSLCAALAERASRLLASSHDTQCLLLIVDRRDDPVTPLLNQWTYQAMIHELIGVENGKVEIGRGEPALQFTLSSGRDKFFAENMFVTYDKLIQNVDRLKSEYKETTDVKLDTIAEMKKAIANMARAKEVTEYFKKHLSLVLAIKSMIERHAFFDADGICMLEQDLLDRIDHSTAAKRVLAFLEDRRLRPIDRVRLVLLYILKFEGNRNLKLEDCVDKLIDAGVPPELRKAVSGLLQYCGSGCPGREGNIFSSTITGELKTDAEKENDYLRHTPLLAQTLMQLQRGKLDAKRYQFMEGAENRPKAYSEVVIFMVGGATYEEARNVARFNNLNPNMRVVLGGTNIHNTTTFLDEIAISVANSNA